jgi:hypothetical protein
LILSPNPLPRERGSVVKLKRATGNYQVKACTMGKSGGI